MSRVIRDRGIKVLREVTILVCNKAASSRACILTPAAISEAERGGVKGLTADLREG